MKDKYMIFFFKLMKKTDSAVTMKKMIPAKILKSTWPALFAEIIVSDNKGIF